MSRDIFVQDIPAGVDSVDEIPDDWEPAPLPFSHADVIAAVAELAPTLDRSNPEWLNIELGGASIEVNIADESPLMSFALHVRGESDEVTSFVSRLLARLGARAFDVDSPTGIFGG